LLINEQGTINKGKQLKGLVLYMIEPCSFFQLTMNSEQFKMGEVSKRSYW